MSAPTAAKELMPCGTPAAFRRHHRRGELACDACLRAHAEREKQRYARSRAAA